MLHNKTLLTIRVWDGFQDIILYFVSTSWLLSESGEFIKKIKRKSNIFYKQQNVQNIITQIIPTT